MKYIYTYYSSIISDNPDKPCATGHVNPSSVGMGGMSGLPSVNPLLAPSPLGSMGMGQVAFPPSGPQGM